MFNRDIKPGEQTRWIIRLLTTKEKSEMAKETKSIYYHYTSLKKQLLDEDI